MINESNKERRYHFIVVGASASEILRVRQDLQASSNCRTTGSGKEDALRRPPPLRTGRESFPSSGSSRCEAPRERSRCHDGSPGVPPLRYALAAS